MTKVKAGFENRTLQCLSGVRRASNAQNPNELDGLNRNRSHRNRCVRAAGAQRYQETRHDAGRQIRAEP
ncbi:hypothetical protein DF3PB_20042 [uncultured Defluviicoccus sp.]|uniref:Uncharacterized protein n=1 Tax=metagenome TaxID=256318 RepID=A0A380TC89_9ZZZZ|nr:hypothetical protein DF3PB_20042 [uncultured Defluviicoccus sp.]